MLQNEPTVRKSLTVATGYIEPAHEPGAYDREVFIVLKEFEPFYSKGGRVA